MPITLKKVTTTREKDQVFSLRHQVFVQEEARFSSRTCRVYDFYDSFEESINILALDNETTPVASIRLTLDNPVGIPAFEHYDFSSYMDQLEGQCVSLGWLCILKRYRRHPGLLMGLLKMVVREMRRNNCRHILATIHPPIFDLLQRCFGARAVGDAFPSDELGVPVLPVHIDIQQVPPGADEPFRDPPNPVLEESRERRIYNRKEVIFRQGDPAREVFYVMRGSVRGLPSQLGPKEISWKDRQGPLAPGDQLLRKGEIFGVLSLLDHGPRVYTMIPYSHEVDVMVWSLDSIAEQLWSSPDTTRDIIRSFGTRLRQMLEGAARAPSRAEVARVLFGASEEGRKAVLKDWLGRQCGIWPHTLEDIVSSWAERDIIRPDNGSIRVTDVDGLISMEAGAKRQPGLRG